MRAKQTQRGKDWPIIERLVEVRYFEVLNSPAPADVELFLRELRTPEVLIEAGARFPEAALQMADRRPAVRAALTGDRDAVASTSETRKTKFAEDRMRWEPLKRELEGFRHPK